MSYVYPTKWRRYITNPVTGNVYKDHEGNHLYRVFGMNNASTYITRVLEDSGVIDDEELTKYQILEAVNTGVFDEATLMMIGATGYKAGILYNPKPNTVAGDFTVTGGGNAVSQRSDGYYQINWPANTPRFKYTSGTPYLITEPQRQNLITYPRSFGNAYWTKSGATIDDNGGAGFSCPFVDSDGVNTNEGMKLVATTANATIKLATPVTTTSATSYANGIFAKRVTGTGAVSLIDVNNTDRSITLTSDWQWFEYAAAASGTTGQIGIKLATSGDEIMICHAQPELGTESTTPIYGTEGSALTRVADVANIATDISSTKTLIINDDAYIVETALPDNGYYLPQIDIERLILSDNVLSDAQITALGATKRQLAFSSYVDIAAGTTASITVNGVGYIDWGDGNTSAYSSEVTLTHVYSSAYKGLVKFVGTLTKLSSSSSLSWYLDIANAPSNLTYLYIYGSNTISGDIANAPANLTTLLITGSNTISGDIANAPSNLTTLYISGLNTISGDIANAPSNLTYLLITGSNTISGDVVNAPSNLTYLQITGSNTISGDIADAPANLTYLQIYGSSQLSDYTSGRTWANDMRYVRTLPASGYGLSSTEVDNLLIDLANVATWTSYKIVDIAGNNAARTSASDAAVATLEGKGVAVTTN